MGVVIHFPSVGERYVRDQLKSRGVSQSARTHSGRALESKLLGLRQAGQRQKPRFTKRTRG